MSQDGRFWSHVEWIMAIYLSTSLADFNESVYPILRNRISKQFIFIRIYYHNLLSITM